MAMRRKRKLTKKGAKKLKQEVDQALKAAEDIVLDLKKIKKDMMSKFPPSYQGVPFAGCPPPPLSRRRRR